MGGFKVVYEYANALVGSGHHVELIHPGGLYLGVARSDRMLRNVAKYIGLGVTGRYRPTNWFTLDPKVSARWVPSLASWFIPDADVVIATAWETAEWVSSYPESKGRKYYLIQHFEDWFGDRERLLRTWTLPLQKIVISRWLGQIAESLGESFHYIPNGLDHQAFGVDVAPGDRNPKRILMLHHHLDWKGTKEGLAAIERVRKQCPGVEVTLFGVSPPESVNLPKWVTYEHLPSRERLRALYNEASLFVSPSWAEGWALPPAEAMQCGCATVLTDIGGHEYAIHGVTSLLSPPRDIEALSGNILTLIENDAYRTRLAHAAILEIAQYTWSRSARSLENALIEG